MNKFKGFLYGMTASATFGLLPLFTLPTMAEGMTTDSILCYRMLFASLLVAVLMMVRRVNFSVDVRELSWLVLLGFFYYGSATLLFQAYGSMSSGMATTLHFLYPVGVTLIMAVLFKQRPSPFTIIAIVLALSWRSRAWHCSRYVAVGERTGMLRWLASCWSCSRGSAMRSIL